MKALAWLVSAALACAGSASASENPADWKHSADLILDTSPAGAGVASTLVGFPLLVRLNAGNFNFAEAMGRGQDIRFSKRDGVRLPYQIERWDSARAVAEVWVRVDTVRGDRAGQVLRMRWGNPAAKDSSNGGAVFNNRHVGVWHMGGDKGSPRPNSVKGAQAAMPVNFDGDESVPGIIGLADSLDGGAPGDYLDLGDGYAGFGGSFMFSVWVCPSSRHWNAPFLELGNGMYAENLMLNLAGTTDDFMFTDIDPEVNTVEANSSIALGEWQFLAVTVDGDRVKLYKNGRLASSGWLYRPLSDTWRSSNFLGKSSWERAGHFRGKIDEPQIHRIVHSEAWMKLTWQNQKADQNLVTLKRAVMPCAERFSAPADTSAPEGGILVLSAAADCAGRYSWSAVSGPVPRILDPEVEDLALRMPRTAGDTTLVLRFTADFRDSSPVREVRVRVVEAIPEPVFAFPADLRWIGGHLLVRPIIANLAEIKASPEPELNWAWTVSGPSLDTVWLRDGILLAADGKSGPLQLGLCLDNRGKPACGTATLLLSSTVSLAGAGRGSPAGEVPKKGFDATGRSRTHGIGRVLFPGVK